MNSLRISLLGKFSISWNGYPVSAFGVQKVQELLSYLLIHRSVPHHREALAVLLWSDATAAQSRQYFRKTLWQLQSALEQHTPAANLLMIDDEWIQVNAAANYWLDVAVLEDHFRQLQAIPGSDLPPALALALAETVALYRGELFQGWYHDWCLNEREHCQYMFFTLLDRLTEYCLLHNEYGRGISYGIEILRCDVARERTYRQLMLLYARQGDRSSAIRQYKRCVEVLRKELDISPSSVTVELYRQICEGAHATLSHDERPLLPEVQPQQLLQTSQLLHHLENVLDDLQRQVAEQREAVDRALHLHTPP